MSIWLSTAGRLALFLALLLPLRAAQAQSGGWVDQRANQTFFCRANFSLAGYEPLLGELGQTQHALAESLLVEPPKEPVELYFFKDKRSYRQYLDTRYPQAPERRALFIKGAGPGKVFVYRSGDLAVDVRHESTHALLHATLPMVPLWLDEGLAEYFEVPPAERNYRQKYFAELRRNLLIGIAPRIERLEQKRDLEEMSAADYRDAWAWVHFMLHGPPEARRELVAYLADIQASTPPGRLSQRLESRLPRVQDRLVQHLKTYKPSAENNRPPSGEASRQASGGTAARR